MDKILFILAILSKSLHKVLGSGGIDETGWRLGLLIFSSPVILPHFKAFVLGRGAREIESQTKTVLETINTLNSI